MGTEYVPDKNLTLKLVLMLTVQDQKNSRKWARMGIHVLNSLDFLFYYTDKCYTEQEQKRFIPPFWKMMTLYVKGDSFEIPGNKEIASKMDTSSSALLDSGISEYLSELCYYK